VANARFLTLTMVYQSDKVKALRDIKKAWNRLRLAITRKVGQFKYCWVLEAQPKSGMPHLHVILDHFIPKAWLDKKLPSLGFGKISDIRKIKDEHVMGYLIKYLTKGLGNEHLEKCLKFIKGRRVGFSRGMSLQSPEKQNWLRIGVAEFHHETQYLKQKLALAGQAQGYKMTKSENSNNFVSVEFSTGNEDPRVAYEHLQWVEAEKFRQKLYKQAPKRYFVSEFERHRALAELKPSDPSWVGIFDSLNDLPDDFLLTNAESVVAFGYGHS
jgi:hypothetical protein